MNINMAKDLEMDPEGMYVSLPVEAKNGEWYLDKAGAMFKAGVSLPETFQDYYAVDRGMVSKTDISPPISERTWIAVMGLLPNPGTVRIKSSAVEY